MLQPLGLFCLFSVVCGGCFGFLHWCSDIRIAKKDGGIFHAFISEGWKEWFCSSAFDWYTQKSLSRYFKAFLTMKQLLQKAESKSLAAPHPSYTLSVHETWHTRIISQYVCPFLGSALTLLLLGSLTLAFLTERKVGSLITSLGSNICDWEEQVRFSVSATPRVFTNCWLTYIVFQRNPSHSPTKGFHFPFLLKLLYAPDFSYHILEIKIHASAPVSYLITVISSVFESRHVFSLSAKTF